MTSGLANGGIARGAFTQKVAATGFLEIHECRNLGAHQRLHRDLSEGRGSLIVVASNGCLPEEYDVGSSIPRSLSESAFYKGIDEIRPKTQRKAQQWQTLA